MSEVASICHDARFYEKLVHPNAAALDIVDVFGVKRPKSPLPNVPLQAPMAWSPDGSLFAGLSLFDVTEILLFSAGTESRYRIACLSDHLADITHMDFVPGSSSIVSFARDGTARPVSTSAESHGKLLKSFWVWSSLAEVATQWCSGF